MPFTVEDGTGLSAANSGCSVADALAYHALRGGTTFADLLQAEQERLLQAGTRDVDQAGKQPGRHWLGYRATTTQALAVPRSGLTTPDGVAIASNVVPEAYRDACAEQAWFRSQSDRVEESAVSAEQSITIGRLSVTNGAGSTGRPSVLSPVAADLLSSLLFVGPVRA